MSTSRHKPGPWYEKALNKAAAEITLVAAQNKYGYSIFRPCRLAPQSLEYVAGPMDYVTFKRNYPGVPIVDRS